jgi:hypothetical protein
VKVGDRIVLLAMPEDPAPLPVGSKGTITKLPDDPERERATFGNFVAYVKWDDGRTLSLCIPPDEVRVIS